MTVAEEILALQLAEDPEFLVKREILYQAMLDAQAKMCMCPEPEFSLLAAAVVEAQNAFSRQGAKWVAHVMCGNATKAAELNFANQVAQSDLKSERHREVNRESMRKSRNGPDA